MKILVADNFWLRFRGLMFRKEPLIIIFPFKKPTKYNATIHSCFVFFDFYAIYVDEKGYISEKILVKPFKLRVTPKDKVLFLIEVPVEVGKSLKEGDFVGNTLDQIISNLKKVLES